MKKLITVICKIILFTNLYSQWTYLPAITDTYGTGFVSGVDYWVNGDKSTGEIKAGEASLASYDYLGWTMFDISAIPSNAEIISIRVILKVKNNSSSSYFTLCMDELNIDPRSSSVSAIDILNSFIGTSIYKCEQIGTENEEVDIYLYNTSAISELQYAVEHGMQWWGVFLHEDGFNDKRVIFYGNDADDIDRPVLAVAYTVPCSIPGSLTIISTNETTANLDWSYVSGNNGYQVRYKPATSSSWNYQTSSTSSCTVSGLTCGTTYDWGVRTYCGSSNYSNWVTGSDFTTSTCICSTPTGLSESNITENSVYLDWSNVSGASCGYVVIYRVAGSGASWTTLRPSVSNQSISGLDCNTQYEWKVCSNCCNDNYSEWTTTRYFTTSSCPCNVPSSLSVSSITDNSAYFDWSSVSGNSGYELWYKPITSSTWIKKYPTNSYYTATGLDCNTTYEWYVRTECEGDNHSNWVTGSEFTTSICPNTPPNKPTLLIPSNGSSVTVPFTLSWDCSDPDGDPLTYSLWLAKKGTDIWDGQEGITEKYIVISEEPSEDEIGDYLWKVIANDGFAESESEIGEFTLLLQQINVLTPNENTYAKPGTHLYITWEDDLTENVRIDLEKNNVHECEIESSTGLEGHYLWDLPCSLAMGNDYRVKITSVLDNTIFGYSHTFNIIDPAYIEIIDPNNTTIWNVGTTNNINWNSDVTTNLTISLYKGESFQNNIVSFTSNTGSFPWDIPTSITTDDDYRIKITSVNSCLFNFSDHFTIINNVQHPPNQPTLLTPLDGSTVTVPFVISWECSDPDGDELTYTFGVRIKGTTDWEYEEMNNTTYFEVTDIDENDYDTYEWKIIASDGEAQSESDIWEFAIINPCSSPTSSVPDNTGTSSVIMTCTASGGSGGDYQYKWYSGTSCSGTILETNATLNITESGYYACKVYIEGCNESTYYDCDHGYATVNPCIPLSRPGSITGETSALINNTYNYEIPPIAEADSYNWNATGGDVSGNSNAVSVTWNSLGNQILSVEAVNSCGISDATALNVIVVNSATSIANTTENSVTIYPNPFKDEIFISLDNSDEILTIAVYNALGVKVKEVSKIHLSETVLNMTEIKEGMYSLIIYTTKGRVIRSAVKF